mmetsp:Transcript_46501/g.108599  ORF Transcript_46501/g.108599 Transcript_46501/m.108599 type:complete len:215 (-) Transcript_46501:838-1482(-)
MVTHESIESSSKPQYPAALLPVSEGAGRGSLTVKVSVVMAQDAVRCLIMQPKRAVAGIDHGPTFRNPVARKAFLKVMTGTGMHFAIRCHVQVLVVTRVVKGNTQAGLGHEGWWRRHVLACKGLQGLEGLVFAGLGHEGEGIQDHGKLVRNVDKLEPLFRRLERPKTHQSTHLQDVPIQEGLELEVHQLARMLEVKELEDSLRFGRSKAQATGGR